AMSAGRSPERLRIGVPGEASRTLRHPGLALCSHMRAGNTRIGRFAVPHAHMRVEDTARPVDSQQRDCLGRRTEATFTLWGVFGSAGRQKGASASENVKVDVEAPC